MNTRERLFLASVAVVGLAAILLVLHVSGIPLPLLPAPTRSLPVARTPDDVRRPPPAPPAEEEGLLAELRREGDDADRREARRIVPVEAAGTAPEDEVAPEAPDAPGDGRRRDPVVDAMRAAMDPSDPGQLMAFLIGTFTPNGTKLSGEDLGFLLDALDAQEDFGVRNLLFAHLERIGGEEASAGVLTFLEGEPDRAAALRAIRALGSLADDRAAEGLVSVLAGSRDGRIQREAFQSLLRTKNRAAADDLLAALDGSTNPATRRYALAALSQLDGELGARSAMRYAASGDPFERGIGRKSLRDIRSPDAVPVLGTALLDSRDKGLRRDVLRTLGQIGDPAAVDPVGRVLLLESDRSLRVEAIRTLARIGTSETLPALGSAAAGAEEPVVKRAAERAIRYVRAREAARADGRRRD